ncbi:hypothetical protein GCM10020331_028930 [Ectobacillus funiculus]
MIVFLDVGNAIIDGFIMRDPGSYEDIIDILVDEKGCTAERGRGPKGGYPSSQDACTRLYKRAA